ncbi:MAG: DEAD/DEAH box helicase [Myxococcota bacterium]
MTASSLKSSAPAGFEGFGLDPALVRGTHEAGFESPRPIQLETLPAALVGRDVLGLAQTGTGKTAAFALAVLERLLASTAPGDPRALILAPTRELAQQIDAEIRLLARFTPITTATIFGGVSVRAQIGALRRRPAIVVGCPGRVLDLVQQRALRLSSVEILVLDEADHMFDLGFLPDLRRILSALPTRRQNLLFSATMPRAIRQLADEVLRDPDVVELTGGAPADTIDHAIYAVPEHGKRDLLDRILCEESCEAAIVFTRTKHRARRLAQQLEKSGHRTIALQGNMSQSQRDRAMNGFRARRYDVLVATDIAARGIDVSSVSHVINFDVPSTALAYTHRIGRTGRSEREGVARTFVTSDDRAWLRDTERMIGTAIPRLQAQGIPSERLDAETGRPAPARRSATELTCSRNGRNRPSRARRRGRPR